MIVLETLCIAIRQQLIAASIAGGNVDKDRNEPTGSLDLPSIQVAIGPDIAIAEGDPRTGIPRFEHKSTLTVVAYDHADSGPQLRAKLAAHAEAIMTCLLGDLAWQQDAVEGIAGLRQVYEAPPDGNEIAGRVQVQFDVLLRTHWPPVLPADVLATVSAGVAVADGTPQPGITVTVPTE